MPSRPNETLAENQRSRNESERPMSDFLRLTGPWPENGPHGPAEPADDWPTTDRFAREDLVRRLNNCAGELNTLGRYSNSYKAQLAASLLANFLSSGANEDEAEIIMRNLLAPTNSDLTHQLRPQDLSWSYFRGPDDPGHIYPAGVRLRHIPTGVTAEAADESNRTANARRAHAILDHRVEAER
jgi:hypothetical protein